MRRRSLLAAVGSAVTVGGCLSAGADDGCGTTGVPQGGLRLLNADAAERVLDLKVFFDLLVVRDVVYDQAIELPGRSADSERHTLVEDVVDRAGRHVLRARVHETGETTDYLWDVSSNGCTGLVVAVNDGTADVSPVEADTSSSGIASGGENP